MELQDEINRIRKELNIIFNKHTRYKNVGHGKFNLQRLITPKGWEKVNDLFTSSPILERKGRTTDEIQDFKDRIYHAQMERKAFVTELENELLNDNKEDKEDK